MADNSSSFPAQHTVVLTQDIDIRTQVYCVAKLDRT